MKKIVFFASITLSTIHNHAQVNQEIVSIGSGYQHQTYYSLADGEVAQIDKNSWDLAFDASGMGAGIRLNGAKGLKLFEYPNGDINLFGESLDTTGLSTWNELLNSNQSWEETAFNANGDPDNDFDLGWGQYNSTTHAITGQSLYILQKSDSEYLQIVIDNLSGGTFSFRYADLNGDNMTSSTISKNDYNGKNFGYYNLTSHTTLDLDPPSNSWDLLFTSYKTLVGPGMVYGVTGVLSNKAIEIAKVENVNQVDTYANWGGKSFSEATNTIGYDWKSLNHETFEFETADSLVYFIKSAQGDIWKVYFTGFGGSANGDFEFTKELMSTVSLSSNEKTDFKFTIYPNPSNTENIALVYDLPSIENAELFVTDLSGKILQRKSFIIDVGLSTKQLQLTGFKPGIYLVNLKISNGVLSQKLIIQ